MSKKNKNTICKKKNGKDDYLEEIKEWQEHNFNPYHYVGGNMPPYIKNPGKPVWLGLFMIVSAIIGAWFFTWILIAHGRFHDFIEISGAIVCGILMYGIIVLYLIGGIRLVKKGYILKRKDEWKQYLYKDLIKLSIFVMLIILISTTVVPIFLYKECEIKITSQDQKTPEDQLWWYSTDGTNYLDLKAKDIQLKYGDEYDAIASKLIWDEAEVLKNHSFIIKYKQNRLFPKYGKLIKFTIVPNK